MSKTTVVNKEHEPYDVYIGRPSKWGNPFKIGEDGSRLAVLVKYIKWIRTNVDLVIQARKELKGKRLGCYCKPKLCHGDILVHLIEYAD